MPETTVQNVGNWNFLLSLAIPGFGLFTSPAAPSEIANGQLDVFVNGDSTAAITSKFVVATQEHILNQQTQGNAGKDFEIRVTLRSTDGGRRFIAPIELEVNAREAQE